MKRSSASEKLWRNFLVKKVPGTTPIEGLFWKLVRNGKVLCEVGCGSGRVISEILERGFMVTGSDINNSAVLNLRSKIKATKMEHRVNVLKDDICETKLPLNKFDGAFMQGVLGAITRGKRLRALEQVRNILKPKGFIHVAEFGMMKKQSMIIRYKNDHKITGEYGTLSVRNDDDKEIYRTHNFTEKELVTLAENAKLKVLSVKHRTFTSYHGNRKPGLTLILQK
ncbi:MAG: class I SAM-dependent methyltransferase [Patescibacteria group bacterium]